MKPRATLSISIQGQRQCQEDRVLANPERGIFVAADGFGGPGPGDLAAQTACEAVRGFLEKEAGDVDATLPFVLRSYFSLPGNVLFNALIHANRKLRNLNRGKGVHERGGASVISAYLDQDLMAFANAGACTAWLVRDGHAAELVIPKTYARLCDPFQSQDVPGRDVPLMALGLVDDLEPEIVEIRVKPGDWVVLSTDGLKSEGAYLIAGVQSSSGGESPEAQTNRVKAEIEQLSYQDNLAFSLIIF